MGLVVCLSGRIGSGKSSVATALSDQLAWPRAGFGDYLRQELTRLGGDPSSRQALQDLGQSLVEKDAAAFCLAVVSDVGFLPGGDLVIDGVRHANIQHCLRRVVAPSACKLIFLAADEEERLRRVAQRPLGEEDFARAEGHAAEADMTAELPMMADKIVDGSQPIETVLAECLSTVRGWKN